MAGGLAPAGMPAPVPRFGGSMPEASDPPAKHGRSLTGFYLAAGLTALLLGLGAWASTPLRIWYWERAVRDACWTSKRPRGLFRETEKRATRLARVGPASLPAFERLLRDEDIGNRHEILLGLRDADATWAMPLVVEVARKGDRDLPGWAILVACSLAKRAFADEKDLEVCLHQVPNNLHVFVPEGRAKLFDWWEREGKARYGGGEK